MKLTRMKNASVADNNENNDENSSIKDSIKRENKTFVGGTRINCISGGVRLFPNVSRFFPKKNHHFPTSFTTKIVVFINFGLKIEGNFLKNKS